MYIYIHGYIDVFIHIKRSIYMCIALTAVCAVRRRHFLGRRRACAAATRK